jgi:hypothetical protein
MPIPNALTDGSYDQPGDPNYGSGAGLSAAEIIARQRHPEVLQDPTVLAAQTPADRERAIAAGLKNVDPSYDPNNVYKTSSNGSLAPNTGSWFSDHLPLIAALMGGALGGAGLIAGGAAGGGAAAAGAGTSTGVGPLAGGLTGAATTAAAPAGIAAGGSSGILGAAGSLLGGGQSLGSTGGILNAAGRVGSLLSGVEADRQAARTAQANATQAQDRNGISAAALNLAAPNARLSGSVKGDIAANEKDFSYGAPTMVGNIPVPTSTGGLRPSLFSQNTRNLGALNSQQALANETADGGKPAQLTPLPAANGTDSILNTAGTIASLAGAIPYQAPKPTQPIFYNPYGGTR